MRLTGTSSNDHDREEEAFYHQPGDDLSPTSEQEFVCCDLCGSGSGTAVLTGRDYRFGRREHYSFVQCEGCGLIRMNPRPTREAILQLYQEDYQVEDRPVPADGRSVPGWKKGLKTLWHKVNGQYLDGLVGRLHGRVLDVGCGVGNLLLLARQRSCEVFGVETNPKAVEVCRRRGIEVSCGSVEDAGFRDSSFSVVVMSQVIEHVPSPRRTMEEIRRILRPGGTVFVFCPNAASYHRALFGRYWQGWHIPFHFYAFDRKTVSLLAAQSGFKVASIEAVTPDSFFVTSLKSYLYGEREGVRAIDQGKWADSLALRAAAAPFLRILDNVYPGGGDCLQVQLTR